MEDLVNFSSYAATVKDSGKRQVKTYWKDRESGLEYKCTDDYNDGLVDVWVQNFNEAFAWTFLATLPKDGWLKAARRVWEAL
jgi:hypothetical protein